MRYPRLVFVVTLVIGALSLAGCGRLFSDHQNGRWTALARDCPVLTGQTASTLRMTGIGTPLVEKSDTDIRQFVSCIWRTEKSSFSAIIVIYRMSPEHSVEEEAARQFRKQLERAVDRKEYLAWNRIPDLEDQAYEAVDMDSASLLLAVQSSNAKITVDYYVGPMTPETWEAKLTQYRPILRDLMNDILDDLR